MSNTQNRHLSMWNGCKIAFYLWEKLINLQWKKTKWYFLKRSTWNDNNILSNSFSYCVLSLLPIHWCYINLYLFWTKWETNAKKSIQKIWHNLCIEKRVFVIGNGAQVFHCEKITKNNQNEKNCRTRHSFCTQFKLIFAQKQKNNKKKINVTDWMEWNCNEHATIQTMLQVSEQENLIFFFQLVRPKIMCIICSSYSFHLI